MKVTRGTKQPSVAFLGEASDPEGESHPPVPFQWEHKILRISWRGGKGWEGTYWRMAGSWLLPRAGFHVRGALPLRVPEAEGRTGGMEGSTSHPLSPQIPTTDSVPVDSGSPTTDSVPVDSQLAFCAGPLSPLPKPGAEQWAKAEGYLLTDNLPT